MEEGGREGGREGGSEGARTSRLLRPYVRVRHDEGLQQDIIDISGGGGLRMRE